MGNSISAQVEQLENKQMQTEVKDQLDFMVKAATAKLDGYQVELEEFVTVLQSPYVLILNGL